MAKSAKQTAPKMYADRIRRCRRAMKKDRLDGYLLSNPVDFRYVTGFTGNESAAMVTSSGVQIISDGRFEQQLKKECPWAPTMMRKGLLNDEIIKACKVLKIKRMGVQSEHLTVADFEYLQKKNKSTRVVGAPGIIDRMRKFKEKSEVLVLRKAIKIAEDAFLEMRKTIRIGQTETEMAARLEYEMRRRGASGPAFGTICAEGANGALPHAHPGTRKVKAGSSVLFDWGACYQGYNSDLTRMIFVGSIPPKIATIYKIVLKAQLLAIDAIRPGKRMCDIDAIARKFITEQGFGDQFNHGLGHGLGMDVHESVSLSWRSDEKLAEGMFVTVEPGIYLPGIGGVRIEDDILVTKTGCRVLTNLNKSLKGAVITARR